MKRIYKIFFLVMGIGVVAGISLILLTVKPVQSQNYLNNIFLGPAEGIARRSLFTKINPPESQSDYFSVDNSTYFNPDYFPNQSALYYSAGYAPASSPAPLQSQSSILDQAAFEVRSLIALYKVTNTAASVHYDVPVKSQQDYLNGTACVPTSVAMVMDYYHQTDASLTTETISKFIANLDEGDITEGYGISVNKIVDDLWKLGYRNTIVMSGPQMNMNTLIDFLKEGPVIVQTGVELGNNPRRILGVGERQHAMVLKGITADGRSVIVNDPWSGAELEFSLARFVDMWDSGHNIVLMIRT